MARAIDAEGLEKELLYGDINTNETFEEYIDRVIRQAPTIEPKQEWIDVHDRLPDKDTLVLCVGAKGGMFLGYVRYLYGDDKTAYVRVPNARGGRYAAFWMPLPDPPENE